MRRKLLLAPVAASLAVSASALAASLPSAQLVKRLADRGLVVTPARPGDRPRVPLKRVIASMHIQKPYLVYALRLTDTQWGNFPNLVVEDRLVWLFITPHARFPILGGNCSQDCLFYADAASVVDASTGRWLLTTSLGP